MQDKETSERSSMARDIAGYQKEQLAEVKARYLGELNLLRAEGQAIAGMWDMNSVMFPTLMFPLFIDDRLGYVNTRSTYCRYLEYD